MAEYCEEGGRCRHAYLMEYFGEASRFPGGRCPLGCDNCERAQQPPAPDGEPGLLTGFDWTEWEAQASGLDVLGFMDIHLIPLKGRCMCGGDNHSELAWQGGIPA